MSQRISRRELTRRGLIGMAALATPSVVLAKAQDAPKPAVADSDLANIEKQLAKPMPESAKKLLKAAVQNNRGNAEARMKFNIPDAAEPATMYFAKEGTEVKP
jgi:hypothetical protein